MYRTKPSVVIINGINNLGLTIAKSFGHSSHVLLVGNEENIKELDLPKHISAVSYDGFSTVKLSGIKNIIALYHERTNELISATDLVQYAKFLSDIFHIATVNNAKTIVTTSLTASKQYVFSKYSEKDQPYDFPSLQNFIEKLALEQNRKSLTYILRVGDLYGDDLEERNVISRIISDATTNNYVRVDNDGLERLYPVAFRELGQVAYKVFNSEIKGGIYTLAPKEGITQISIANIAIQYSTTVSFIKFIKVNSFNLEDPMYENIYKSAPYITNSLTINTLEKDLPNLIKHKQPERKVLRKENVKQVTQKQESKLKGKVKSKLYKFSIIFLVSIITFIFAIIPPTFALMNTRLLVDSNKIFFNNYSKSSIAEISEDSKYNKDKSSNLLGALRLSQWLLPIIGDDFKSNQNFLNAQIDYFDALNYSKDYNFVAVEDSNRSIVQIKLQSAKSLIKQVDKYKLFWDLQDVYDNMNRIIQDSSVM